MSRIIIARAFACAGLVVAGADTAAAQNAPVARTATLDEIEGAEETTLVPLESQAAIGSSPVSQ